MLEEYLAGLIRREEERHQLPRSGEATDLRDSLQERSGHVACRIQTTMANARRDG